MENAPDNNSNSGSDISDSWAVIDDDSPLEWNNVIGLRPHQNDCTKSYTTSGLPSRSNSRNEQSDEESIEVVAEDHTDDLSDKDMEVVQDENCRPSMANQLDIKEDIFLGTINPDLPHYAKPSQRKKENVQWTESNSILITILVMGILAGLCVGYLCAPHSHEPEASTSIQPTRTLLRKLQSDNLFLRRRLRSAHALMKATISKPIPNLNDSTKQDSAHTSLKAAISKTIPNSDHLMKVDNKTNQNSLNLSDSGMCSITDFMLQAPILHDYCLVSDKPETSENVWTNNTDRNASNNSMPVGIASASSSEDTSFVKDYILTQNTGVNDYKSIEPLGSLLDSYNIDTVHQDAEVFSSLYSEGKTDPRPYTKLRTTMEKIYTILFILDNEKQTVLPSKQELLSILPQNMDVFGLSKQHFTTNVQEKISSLEMQIEGNTQKLFDEMDSQIDILVQNIAFMFKEVEYFNKKVVCDLKTSLENSADIDLLDLNQMTIFQKCVDDKDHHNHVFKSENQHEMEGKCSESEMFTATESIISDHNEPIDPLWAVNDKEHVMYSDYENKNVQQSEKRTGNYELRDTSSMLGHNGSPAPKIDILHDESLIIEVTDLPIQHEADLENKIDESSEEIKNKIMETDGAQAKYTDHAKISKRGKSGTRRISESKAKKYNESRGKIKYSGDDSSVRIGKHDKSGRKRMYNKEQKYDDAYGKRKYSDDLDDYAKISKHEKSGKKRISENKVQKYDESHSETRYSDVDGAKMKDREGSGKNRKSDNKEQKYDKGYEERNYPDDNDDVKIRKHEKSGKKKMSDTKQQKYAEAYGKTKGSDSDVKIRKHEKSGKKRMSYNQEQKYNRVHGETKDSIGDSVKIRKHEKFGENKMSDTKEQKYDEVQGKSDHDSVNIRQHEKSSEKRMSNNKEQKYNGVHGETKDSNDDGAEIRKHETSDKTRMLDNKEQKYNEVHGETKDSNDDGAEIRKHEMSDKKRMLDNKDMKYNEVHGETKVSDDDVNINKNVESDRMSDSDNIEKKYSDAYGKGQQKRNRSHKWTVDSGKTSNVSGEWVTKMAHGRAEQRRRDHESDWVFDRAESRELSRKKSTRHSHYYEDRDYSSKFVNFGVCNKTRTFKDEASKNWKVIKQSMKEKIWKPLLNTAKSAKKTFNKFRYHSRRE